MYSSLAQSRSSSPRLNTYFRRHPTSQSTPLINPTFSLPLFPKNRKIISHPSFRITKCNNSTISPAVIFRSHENTCTIMTQKSSNEKKSFWGAVSLIIGTAVGPGMLGLPSATIKSGSFPSTIAIILSWVYVISSIVLVAELSFAAMEEDEVEEVSFTGLATKALGSKFGAFVALVYASLSFSLLIACVSGIGSILSQLFPKMNLLLSHALFPAFVGIVMGFFPFSAIDFANRILCFVMFFSITLLVTFGLSVARKNVISSFGFATWNLSSVLPAIPVTVLTLGFHVITPFICKLAGKSVSEARKAVLVGGVIPLVMVLSWNLIVLGITGNNGAVSSSRDPISLLLSVNPSALSAVQGFAFSALATSFIGYVVSLPKQLLDTADLIFGNANLERQKFNSLGRVGSVSFSGEADIGNMGEISFNGGTRKVKVGSNVVKHNVFEMLITPVVIGVPVLIAAFFPSIFSRALDYAGVYANCFLFGILPPAMAYIQLSRKKLRSTILPGGNTALLLLFGVAVILMIWH